MKFITRPAQQASSGAFDRFVQHVRDRLIAFEPSQGRIILAFAEGESRPFNVFDRGAGKIEKALTGLRDRNAILHLAIVRALTGADDWKSGQHTSADVCREGGIHQLASALAKNDVCLLRKVIENEATDQCDILDILNASGDPLPIGDRLKVTELLEGKLLADSFFTSKVDKSEPASDDEKSVAAAEPTASNRQDGEPVIPARGEQAKFRGVGGSEKSEPACGLDLESIGAVLRNPVPPRRIVYGYLCERGVVTMLAAPPGVGKTTLGAQIACLVAGGISEAGFDVPQPGKVIYINTEESHLERNRRFEAIASKYGLDEQALDRLRVPGHEGPLDLMERVDGKPAMTRAYITLAQRIDDERPALVVIDPLALVHSLDENLNGDMSALIGQFQKLARRVDCSILLIHHTGKNLKAPSLEWARGASALGAAVRSMWSLHEGESHPDTFERGPVMLTCVKSNNFPASNQQRLYRRSSVTIREGDSVGTLAYIGRNSDTPASVRGRTVR